LIKNNKSTWDLYNILEGSEREGGRKASRGFEPITPIIKSEGGGGGSTAMRPQPNILNAPMRDKT
jgi:hypothetical protein